MCMVGGCWAFGEPQVPGVCLCSVLLCEIVLSPPVNFWGPRGGSRVRARFTQPEPMGELVASVESADMVVLVVGIVGDVVQVLEVGAWATCAAAASGAWAPAPGPVGWTFIPWIWPVCSPSCTCPNPLCPALPLHCRCCRHSCYCWAHLFYFILF